MSRWRGQGTTWFKKRAVSRRLNIESAHADARDVGGLRVDLEALLAAPVEDFEEYDLDIVVAQRAFRARARAWFGRMHRTSQAAGGTHG